MKRREKRARFDLKRNVNMHHTDSSGEPNNISLRPGYGIFIKTRKSP